MSDQIREPENAVGENNTQENVYNASDAFGADPNSYAYPSSKGLSGYGVASIICGLFGFFCMLTVFAGIGIGIAGIARDRRDVLSCIGLVLSVVFLIVNIVSLVRFCGSGISSDIFASFV